VSSRRFYIASSLDNAPMVRRLASVLLSHGHVLTYDWTAHGAVYRAEQTASENVAVMQETARREIKGVTSADIVIVLLPGGRGTHIEMGAALASGKRVLVVGCTDKVAGAGPNPCAFYFHPRVQHVRADHLAIAEEVDRAG
jgi:hypothetical protein